MLMTLTCYAPNAADVGYLLGKNPASTFERPFSAGTVWVFYPEVADDHVTVALLTEIDPVGLVRGPAALAQLDQYVNDRPYVASSLTSVALKTAFSTALAGRSASPSRAGRLNERMRWVVTLPAVACDGGDDLIERIFAPLGYAVTIEQLPLDERFPAWGMANVYRVTLDGMQTTRDVLSHLYVLLPVLDNSKHYYVGPEETDKLLAHGGAWLAAHPERDLIARRYLRYKRPLVQSALDRLIAADAQVSDETDTNSEDDEAAPPAEDPAEPEIGLHELRLNTVLAAIREAGAHSLADLGCGEGKLLALALKERTLTRIVGMDVSSVTLARARRRLRLDTLPTAQRQRIEVVQGSLLYRDQRLAGFDAVALVEVIEHLDPPRLAAMERVVFQHARPRRVIVTTPNREYNAHWQAVGETRLRHSDHRFEWARAECRFLDDDALDTAFITRLTDALTAAGFWERYATDWVCLDAELLPWSAKAQGLLREQYAPVAAAGQAALAMAIASAEAAQAQTAGVTPLIERLRARQEDIARYADAYRRYCWETDGLAGVRLAPFHLLATEGRTYFDHDHLWHMSELAQLAEADPLFLATNYRAVNVLDEAKCAEAAAWWEATTGTGSEGMVVKPLDFIVRGSRGLVQPALKTRGREYLRIIYGPDYTEPANLERLRLRGLRSKRALAVREFALGVESLERFIRREPLWRVHQAVFEVLALESEPVDPRL